MSILNTRVGLFGLLIAVMPLTMASDCGGGQPMKGKTDKIQWNEPEHPSCEEVGHVKGIRGRVIGSAWDEDGPDSGITRTCLEIETKAGKDLPEGAPGAYESRLIRVPRRVFDRCIEGDRYPRCARGEARS